VIDARQATMLLKGALQRQFPIEAVKPEVKAKTANCKLCPTTFVISKSPSDFRSPECEFALGPPPPATHQAITFPGAEVLHLHIKPPEITDFPLVTEIIPPERPMPPKEDILISARSYK